MLERTAPIWLLLLVVLVGALFTVGFGWAVLSTTEGSDRSGVLGEWAVEMARFPRLARNVVQALELVERDPERPNQVPRPEADLSGFEPVRAVPGIHLPGLLVRADRPAPGWRLLAGTFDVDGRPQNAALLLSPALEVVNVWTLTETRVNDNEPRPPDRKFVHGVAILDDGSLVHTFDGGVSLQRLSRCGERRWAIGGNYHHAVTRDPTGASVWTLRFDEIEDGDRRDRIIQVGVDHGEIIREISLRDVISANPKIDILEIRRAHENDVSGNSRNTGGEWMAERFHLNDVEPLPPALADRFDGFAAGDLLISSRSLNLLFVIDPESLKVKWWRIGATERQHDPDWQPDGTISVFNNRMSRDYSEIISIDPATYHTATIFDGRTNDFYSRIRGKHQITPKGYLVITSTQQGRAFEVDPSGNVVLEFVNTKPGSETVNYVVSELKWLPPEAVKVADWTCAN